MPNASDFLSQYIKSGMDSQDPKKSAVAAAAQAKTQALRDRAYRNSAATDAGFASPEAPFDISDPTAAAAYVEGSGDYTRDATATRSPLQAIGDTAIDAAGAVFTTPVSIANIPINAVDAGAGATVSRFIEKALENSQGQQSDSIQRRRNAYAARNSVTSEHNQVLFQEERGQYGDTLAGFRRVGRDILDGFRNMDGQIAASTVGSGIGSLALGNPLGKLAGAVSGGRLGILTGVGAMEGAGAQQETITKILSMSHDELMRGSKAYRQAIEEGASEQEAKEGIASVAGLTSAAIQGPIAAGIGKLTGISKFEANPLAIGARPREMASDLIREAIEEGSQSGTGTLTRNLAVGMGANDDQSLLDDVGESIAQGVVGGLGSAGVTQAPGAALRTAVAAVVIPTKAAIKGGKALIAAGSKLRSNITTAQADTVIDAATTEAPVIAEQINQTVDTVGDNDVERDEARTYVSNLVGNLSPERVAAFRNAIEITSKPDVTPEELTEAGLTLMDMQREANSTENPDLPAALEKLKEKDPENPVFQQIEEMRIAVQTMAQHPNIGSAIEKAVESLNTRSTGETVNEGDVSSETAPDERTVSNTARLAEHRPDQVKPDTAKNILFHADRGDIEITPEQRRPLEAAVAFADAVTERQERAKRLGLKSSKDVTAEITVGKGDPDLEDLPSVATYMRDINYAARAGNIEKAKIRLQELLNFAQHMQNKVGAINESFAKGGGSSKEQQGTYIALNPRTKTFDSERPRTFGVSPWSTASVRVVQEVANNARLVATVANNLTKIYKDLGLKPVQEVQLDSGLYGTAEDVAADYNNRAAKSGNTSPKTAVISKPTTTPEPMETGQPKGGDTSDETKAPVVETKAKVEAKPAKQADEREVLLPAKPRPAPVSESIEAVQEEAPAPVVETVTKALEEAIAQPIEETRSEERAPVEEAKSEPVSAIEEAYPGLVEDSWFYKHFTMPKEQKSNLVGLAVPITAIIELLGQGQAAVVAFAGRKLKNTIDAQIVQGFDAMFRAADKIHDSMKAELAKAVAKKQKRGLDLNLVKAEYRELKVLHLADENFNYNENLLQGAILAGLNWVLTSGQQGRVYKDEEIAEILKIDEASIDTVERNWFQQGLYLADSVDSLAQNIVRFWGVKLDKSAPIGELQGLTEAMAKEVLVGLAKAGLIKLSRLDFIEGQAIVKDALIGDEAPKGAKSYLQVQTTISKEVKDQTSKFANLLDEVISTEPEPDMIIGEPSTQVDEFQDRAQIVPTTKMQRDVQRKVQATAHTLNMTMVNFARSLGLDNALALYGYGNLEQQGTMNRRDWEAKKGFNLTIIGAYDHMEQLVNRLENAAETEGSTVKEMKVFYRYAFSKVGRLHAQGSYNPQASKFMREISLPSKSTIDLNDAKAKSVFMLAVGQHWGVKVHKQPRATTLKKVDALAADKFGLSLGIIQTWLKSGATRSFNADELEIFQREFGNQASPGAIHAAVEYARYLNASKEERSKFTTQLYVEADGVTDGPINALMHLATGEFKNHWVKMMAKGGLFIGNDITTLSDYIAQGNDTEKDDLYTSAAKATKQNLVKNYNQLMKSNPKVGRQLHHVLIAMGELLDGLTYEGVEAPEIDRKLTKNPLTVVVYGSGERGLANKLVNEMMGRFYEKLSEGSVSPELETAMNALTDHYIGKTKEGKLFVGNPKETPKPSGTGLNYSLGREQLANLQDNVLKLFVPSLQAGIDAVIGNEVRAAKNAVRDAVQIQSIFITNAYRTAIEAEIEKLDKPSHIFLDQVTMDQIHAKVAEQFHVIIETPTQKFYPAASERTEINDPNTTPVVKVDLSRTLDEKLSTPYRMQAPADAGVRGIPYIVIGTGDGQMIMNIVMDGFAPDGALYVFDGVNVKLSTAEADSKIINKAVLKGWTANPLDAVTKSFSAFLDAGISNLENLTADEYASVVGSLNEEFATDPKAGLEQMAADLAELALQSQARKNVLAKVNVSIDHMASLEAPHQETGKLQLEGTPEEIAEQLNNLYLTELAKLKGEPAVEAQAETSEAETSALLETKTFTPAQFRTRLGIYNFSKDQAIITNATLAALDNDHKIVIGPNTEFTNARGVYSAQEKTIYIIDETPETITHELIHAATTNKIYTYFNNPSKLNSFEKSAIERIRDLRTDWLLELNQKNMKDLTSDENLAFREMNKSEESNLDEFIAWVLSNTELAEKAKQIKVRSKFAQLKTKLIESLRKLLRIRVGVGDDIFTNLRFNTLILASTEQPTLFERAQGVLLHSSPGYGNSDRLVRIGSRLESIIAGLIRSDPIDGQTAVNEATLTAVDIQESFEANGFPMSFQERSVFTLLTEVMATTAELDPNTLVRAQELYDHVIKNLRVEDFMTDPMDNNQRYYAQQKYNSVLGNNRMLMDAQGRSTLLPSFLALATVNEQFRTILLNMPVPKGERNKGKSLDDILENAGMEAMFKLTRYTAGEKGRESRVAIDSLVDRLTQTVAEQESLIVQASTNSGNFVDKYNSILVDFKDEWTGKGVAKLKGVAARTNNKYVEASANIGATLLSIMNDNDAGEAAKGLMRMADRSKLWHWPRELMNEIIGRTDENANVYDMIKRVRAVIQQLRQQFREHLPTNIADRFSRKLSKDEWSQLFAGLAKTDIVTLRDHFPMTKVMDMLKQPSLMAAEIAVFEGRLQRSHPNEAALFIAKAKELAEYMQTGRVTTPNLLTNAHSIAMLNGEVLPKNAPVATPALIKEIDVLTSLYAYQNTTQNVQDTISQLANDEADGIDFLLAQIYGSRQDEMLKVMASSQARINYFKGHVPSEQRPGVSMQIANDVDRGKLELMGFKRVGDYNGSPAENSNVRRGYYWAPMSGKAPFSQGVMQNVHATASGVDPITGFSIGTLSGGTITDPYMVERIRLRQRRNNATTENLMPRYDQNGKVVAWERSVEPDQMARLEKNTQLHEVVGVWKGRQLEERGAVEFNHRLVDELARLWNKDKRNNYELEGYINIFDEHELKKDKVLADAVRLITPQTRAYIADNFEPNEFWVRKSMINDAIGYRSPSVGDVWTGNSRINPEVTKQMRNFITGIFGKDAYKYMVTAEKFWMNFVSDARTTIVVRSGIVPVANMISNIYHLAARGVPLADIARAIPRKTAEINHYVKTRLQYMNLDAELEAAKVNNDTRLQRQTEAKMQVIRDSWSKLSIKPLLDAGEFTSISDAGISHEETLLVEGKLSSALERWADKLPASVRTAGRYAIVSKDTALFQGLQKSVAYGDFIAKAILYDDITRRKKQSVEYAMGRITEEFVNYDRLAGRSRQYLENSGLLWFWNFKIRAMKVAVSTIRNNPLQAFMAGLVPVPDIFGSVGSPVTDNAASVIANGKAHWSIGPGMGFNAYWLNPTVQLLS